MTDEQVQELQERIETMQFAIDALQRIAAELNAENVGLKQRIARLEATDEQPVFWRTDL